MYWPKVEEFKDFSNKIGKVYINEYLFLLISKRNGNKYITCIDRHNENKLVGYSIGVNIKSNGTVAIRVCNGFRTESLLHRLILGITDSNIQVDHINGNPLDNRENNLRPCNASENAQNRHFTVNKLGVSCITFEPNRQKYRVTGRINGKQATLGRVSSLDEAIIIRDRFRTENLPFSKEARNE